MWNIIFEDIPYLSLKLSIILKEEREKRESWVVSSDLAQHVFKKGPCYYDN